MDKQVIIGFDASRAYVNQRTGTENYSYQILKAIVNIDCQDELWAYYRTEGEVPLESARMAVQRHPISQKRMWTQYGLARKTWIDPIDVLFVPAHVVPFLRKPTVPVVVTIHDLRTEFLPQHDSLLQKIYLNQYVEQIRAKIATHIIAVSEATKQDIIQRLRVPANKITVVYEGVDQQRFNYAVREQANSLDQIRQKYDLPTEYLLFVGTLQPRKNLVRLIEAFQKVLSQHAGLQLVLAGKQGWMADKIYQTPSKLGITNQVRFLDYVDDADLPMLYAAAQALVFPSLYEGFGLPILEAFGVGTPVLTSNIASMPEVGGDHAVYVDPRSVESIANGINTVLQVNLDLDLLNQHLAQFTWEQAGRKTYQILRRVALEGR